MALITKHTKSVKDVSNRSFDADRNINYFIDIDTETKYKFLGVTIWKTIEDRKWSGDTDFQKFREDQDKSKSMGFNH